MPMITFLAWYERSISDNSSRSLSSCPRGLDKPRTLSLDLDKQPSPTTEGGRRRTASNKHPPAVHSNTKVLVAWVESFEDHLYFPLGKINSDECFSCITNCSLILSCE